MKTFIVLLGLFAVVMPACAASTSTLAEVRSKVVELQITRKEPPVENTRKKKGKRITNLPDQGICSGALVSSSGHILTARHCTDGAAKIQVIFSDGREYVAVVRASSVRHDLALIHVDRFNTPFFDLASGLQQGQLIYVMGNPLGITGSLSSGVVAKRNGDVDYIDVTVLPGNSGGPAFNDKGELVGITTAGFIVLFGFAHLNIMQSLDAIQGFALEIQGL